MNPACPAALYFFTLTYPHNETGKPVSSVCEISSVMLTFTRFSAVLFLLKTGAFRGFTEHSYDPLQIPVSRLNNKSNNNRISIEIIHEYQL